MSKYLTLPKFRPLFPGWPWPLRRINSSSISGKGPLNIAEQSGWTSSSVKCLNFHIVEPFQIEYLCLESHCYENFQFSTHNNITPLHCHQCFRLFKLKLVFVWKPSVSSIYLNWWWYSSKIILCCFKKMLKSAFLHVYVFLFFSRFHIN